MLEIFNNFTDFFNHFKNHRTADVGRDLWSHLVQLSSSTRATCLSRIMSKQLLYSSKETALPNAVHDTINLFSGKSTFAAT